jgi:hypothetical protein
MQKHALKESGEQRECLIKGVAKKKNRPQRAKETVPQVSQAHPKKGELMPLS